MDKSLDLGSTIVIAITFALFIIALFTKGLTHDLLLEAGVFLVSVKLIMMAYQNYSYMENLKKDLQKESNAIMDLIQQLH